MDLINSLAEKYAEDFSSPHSELLQAIVTLTLAHHPHAHMMSDNVQGKLLQVLSEIMNPRYILEIGTFTGFSAMCLVQGLQPQGELHTLELREEDAHTAQQFFSQSAYATQLKLHLGNAKDIIPHLPYEWDMVFIDADKVSYIEYYELTLPRLKTGGIIIADNVLFHGQVLADEISGKNAKAIHAFNHHIKNDPRVMQVLLTVRDGLMIIKKL